MYQVTPKNSQYSLISADAGTQPGGMCGNGTNLTVLCTNIEKIRKYKGASMDSEYPIKERGVFLK